MHQKQQNSVTYTIKNIPINIIQRRSLYQKNTPSRPRIIQQVRDLQHLSIHNLLNQHTSHSQHHSINHIFIDKSITIIIGIIYITIFCRINCWRDFSLLVVWGGIDHLSQNIRFRCFYRNLILQIFQVRLAC